MSFLHTMLGGKIIREAGIMNAGQTIISTYGYQIELLGKKK